MPGPQVCDVLIVGSGVAGLSLALRLAPLAKVSILAKAALAEGSSLYAQGGVAAVLNGKEDSFASHIEDTLTAGAGLCRRETVEFVVRHGPEAIRWLIDQGVAFTRERGEDGVMGYHLTREGGHRHRRVIHAADATGRAIETTLEARVRAQPNIRLHEHHIAIDLITRHKLGRSGDNRVLGLYALNKQSGRVEVHAARFVVLATGGASKVYLYSSNPDTSTGDGIAMAWRAGCRVANMEFMQFHPTCLYHPRAKSFLITEAVRGEGGILKTLAGDAFMPRYHAMADLAPRDVVARAIDAELKRSGNDHVVLDITHKEPAFVRERFPNIYERCLGFGVDITRQPIPVVPAAHYTCGGVRTDLAGETDVPNLFAAGEVTCTGLHGANRLASNSLLECAVFADAAADASVKRLAAIAPAEEVPAWQAQWVRDSDEAVMITQNWEEVRRFMWNYVGIVRSDRRLERARHRIGLLQEEINEYYWNFRVTPDLIELRNLALVAELVIECAAWRQESRGLHFNLDHKDPDDARYRVDTLIRKRVAAGAPIPRPG
jgi:L-aspartate oxidase